MKKWITIPIAILFVVYFIAIVEQNNIVGDLLSPILTFLAFAPVFYAFFLERAAQAFENIRTVLCISHICMVFM